jgi:mono/diheme cytochrome c family protein
MASRQKGGNPNMSIGTLSRRGIASRDGIAPQRIVLCWVLSTLFCALAGTRIGSASQKVDTDGLYTHEQAARGGELYAGKCAACHGTDLKGATAPPLGGPVFAANWSPAGPQFAAREEAFTWDDVFFVISTTMPLGKAKSLSDDDRIAILAYILQNGYPEGKAALRADSPILKKTPIERRPLTAAAKPQPPPVFISGDSKSIPTTAGPSQDELNSAFHSTRDCLYHTHDYSGSRFAALDQINSKNAGQLQAICAFQVGEMNNFQTGPIV